MEIDTTLNSFEVEFNDIVHATIIAEPINKSDYFSADFFQANCNKPLEAYEIHLRMLEYEKRVLFIDVETPTEQFQSPPVLAKHYFPEMFPPNQTHYSFFGEYNEKMKKEISELIADKGFSYLRKEENFDTQTQNYRYMPYSCSIYRIERTLGFYLKREGMLRNCFFKSLQIENKEEDFILGGIDDLQKIKEIIDFDYIKYMYGNEGVNKMNRYFQENFIDKFKFGQSILYTNITSLEH